MTATLDTSLGPIDILADLPVGTPFTANGRRYTMADGFELYPAAGKGVFNVIGVDGVPRRLQVKTTTRVFVPTGQP